jgi:hypothetical protein
MGSVIGVLGACGGVGASTFAATVAAVAGAVLVDLDAVGGGVDVLLGIEHIAGARWSSVEVAGGAIDPAHLRDGLPRWGAAPVLAADAVPRERAVAPVLDAARVLGTVVVDLGRVPNEARQAAIDACVLVIVVVPADLHGVAAARSLVCSLVGADVALVVRRGPLGADEVGELAAAPVVGVLPPLRGRAGVALDPHRLPGAVRRAAEGIADGVPA